MKENSRMYQLLTALPLMFFLFCSQAAAADKVVVIPLLGGEKINTTTYTGLSPIVVDNVAETIGLNAATNPGDLMTWDGNNWIATAPTGTSEHFTINNMQPYLPVNYIIALTGTYPARSSMDPFIGEITIFAGNYAPANWAFCNGQLLAITGNEALFSIMGTLYGGNGYTTFALPDLRGRVPLQAGTGPGLTNRLIGNPGGSETTGQ